MAPPKLTPEEKERRRLEREAAKQGGTAVPDISVIDRRLELSAIDLNDPRYRAGIQDPFGRTSTEVKLKDPAWVASWRNADYGDDHIYHLKSIGYEHVRPEDVADLEQLGGYTVIAGGIVRGERGKEYLLKIPRVVFRARQASKTRKNLEMMKDQKGEQYRALNAFADAGGDADAAFKQITPVGRVTDDYERVERVESE